MTQSKLKIVIFVAYHPNYYEIFRTISELPDYLDSSFKFFLFDNTPNPSFGDISPPDDLIYLSEGENLGLSRAFNKCIEWAWASYGRSNVEYFMFFDQDTTVSGSQISLLNTSYFSLKRHACIGVLGCKAIEASGSSYKLNILTGCNNSFVNTSNRYFPVSYVMSSFSIVPSSVFEDLGLFDEALFIDLVDSEFSFRCSSKGYYNILDCSIEFIHVVGTERSNFFGVRFSISSPLRNYYQTRNLIFVAKKYGWWVWFLKVMSKRFIQFSLSGFRNRDLLRRYKYMFLGLKDGVCSKGGKYPYT